MVEVVLHKSQGIDNFHLTEHNRTEKSLIMTEMAVSFAIGQLLSLLSEEVNVLRGVHKEFAYIKDELESIQAFLKDADRRASI
jgi:hypothetical protein